MQKTIHSKLSELFQQHLVKLRNERGWTQRDLAAAVEREPSFVSRIEVGERRVDVVEYFLLLKALGADPITQATELFASFSEDD